MRIVQMMTTNLACIAPEMIVKEESGYDMVGTNVIGHVQPGRTCSYAYGEYRPFEDGGGYGYLGNY